MKRILIVDDQPDIRKLIRLSLDGERYDMYEASDGSMGLRLVREIEPDLLLLDVMLPGSLSGFDLCRLIKEDAQLRPMPVVLLTARAQQADREAGERAGADAYLVKPFSPLALVDSVRTLLTQADQHRHV